MSITQNDQNKLPSPTLKEYTDESGFFFTYPDDLSLTRNETDESTYADITLSSKELAGSLSFRIEDSKVSSNSPDAIQEVKLGKLAASEKKDKDRLVLTAYDSGVLFTLEVAFEGKEQFWTHVYEKIRSSFSFHQETQNNDSSQGSVSDVQFEGEEIIE